MEYHCPALHAKSIWQVHKAGHYHDNALWLGERASTPWSGCYLYSATWKLYFKFPTLQDIQVYKHWYSIQGKVYNDSFSTVCSTITIILFQINSCTWKSIASLLRHLQNKNQKSLLAGLVPRPLPDFISQPWRKIGRRHGIKTRSQTRNGGLGQYKASPCYILTESTISGPWHSFSFLLHLNTCLI